MTPVRPDVVDCAFISRKLGVRTLSLLGDTAQLKSNFWWLRIELSICKGLYFHHYKRSPYPPDANAKLAINELYTAIGKLQCAHAEAAFIAARDFNHTNLKTVLPKFYQHVSCNTRGKQNFGPCIHNVYSPTWDSQTTSLGSSSPNIYLYLIFYLIFK